MAGTVRKVERDAPIQPTLTRVAAYARVSSGKDTMLHSLSAQVSAYSEMIQHHPGWLYCGVYSDEAVTGTKEIRENFQRLLEDCRNGKIDMVITKSISRFARNTVTLLETVRELKSLGVDVFFEEQNIHTMSGEGELMLSILAGFAEEESLSVSENMKWRVRKNFEEGKPWNGLIYGYRYENGVFKVIPEEAEIVRLIFKMYLEGMGPQTIANKLKDNGTPQREYWSWSLSRIWKMLRNITYTGNLILQKTYRPDFRTKKANINRGEMNMYFAEGTHEAIIDKATFDAVQAEIERRSVNKGQRTDIIYPFSGMIVCGNCGSHYEHKLRPSGNTWICRKYNRNGKKSCDAKQIPESVLISATEEIIGSVDALHDEITVIRAENGNRLVFVLKDGTEVTKEWKYRSRAESWTPEMKEKARQKAKE